MKHFYVLLMVFALIASGILVASAQSGGGYDLSWSTVDGGGHTWSTGGGYTLGGAIGQPAAQAPASGSAYLLQGGFWHRACSPQPAPVSVSCAGDQAQLNWTADAANLAYDIYRASTPYAEVELVNKQASVVGDSWIDLQTGTCEDVGDNYYYVVRSTCIGAHADAGEQGEFDFSLVPGS